MPLPENKPYFVSVLVPVYNEISTVQQALDAIIAKKVPNTKFEIIIIESNSTDGTHEVVLRYQDNPRVKLILEEKARGKGHAIRAGLAHAAGDILLIQDADLEYSLDDYERLLAPLFFRQTDFVLGSRHGTSGWNIRQFTNHPIQALLFNTAHWGFTLLINLSLGVWLRDPFTMYKVFRRECLNGLSFTCNRFDFDWELLIKLMRKGCKPMEIPVLYRSRSFKEGKKIRMFYDPITWLIAFAKARFGPLT